ncbi:MAG: hypothetical protein QE278_14230 [Limnobacter sp.]|nr:hypothetical protein [Limnobacter sp.]
MSCTEKELRRWLQTMARMYPLIVEANDHADYTLPSGSTARIAFKELPMRVIALVRLPRMEVVLAYSDAHSANQHLDHQAEAFVKTFMLYTQRGGG